MFDGDDCRRCCVLNRLFKDSGGVEWLYGLMWLNISFDIYSCACKKCVVW